MPIPPEGSSEWPSLLSDGDSVAWYLTPRGDVTVNLDSQLHGV